MAKKTKVKKKRSKKTAAKAPAQGSLGMSDSTAGSKAQAVRDYLREHPGAKNAIIVKSLSKDNVEVTAAYVGSIRRRAKKAKRKASRKGTTTKRAKKTSRAAGTAKGSAWTFPRDTLEDALRVARAIEDKHAGNPMSAQLLAQAVGFRKSNDWRFQNLLRSANQYGLISGSGAHATVSLERIGEDIVAPSGSSQRQKALLEAFRNIDEFANVEKFYGGKKIPEDEFFENTLARNFQIPRDRVKNFKQVFVTNLEYLRAFDARHTTTESDERTKELPAEEPKAQQRRPTAERVREFLDTCFVMMPFGKWFDRYYQEIYVAAIKDAGFEPVRADELFSAGSVVEQIWEQIAKSTVLLADLTDKNPNVFYELGLAHAARRPVVFTTANVEDVPFDLRHLRVIPYETREPDWAEKLTRDVTSYLKNAREEPEKSIPQPFRSIAGEEEEDGT